MSIEEIGKIANALGGASFATLLFIILVGNYRDIWCWGRDRRALEVKHETDKQELEERYTAENKLVMDQMVFWRDIALRNTGLLESQTEQLMTVATQVSSANRKLLAK